MGNEEIQVTEGKVLDFNIKGHKFTLTIPEWFDLKQKVDEIGLYEKDIREERFQIVHKPVNEEKVDPSPSSFILKDNSNSDKYDYILRYFLKNHKSYDKTPLDYIQQFESKCDPRSGYNHTFVYYKDSMGNWGFKINTSNERKYPFSKLGRINDTKSIIGEFLDKIPFDTQFIKREFLTLGISKVTEGRRLKACVDILEHEGHLVKERSIDTNRKSPLYQRKSERLRVGHKREPVSEDSGVPLIPQPTSSNGTVG
jgi:hypothetical protein